MNLTKQALSHFVLRHLTHSPASLPYASSERCAASAAPLVCLYEKTTPARAGEGRDHMNERLRKWTALAVVLIGMLASGAALGQDPGPCHETYLQSGLSKQQMTFDDFRGFYAD